MRKRLVSAALVAAMALSMTACTSNPAEKETEAAAPADTEAAEEGEEKSGCRRRSDYRRLCTGWC